MNYHKPKILAVIDVQRDFCDPSGSLYVDGSETLPPKIAGISSKYDGIIFTLDWHPADHCSFVEHGGLWPSHCVAYTQGAGLPDLFSLILERGREDVCLHLKGQDREREQYGAFEHLSQGSTEYCWLTSCESVDVCGIAGDFCVKESTANILKIVPAQKVGIIMDCVRSIDGGAALEKFIKENRITKK